MDAKAGKRVFPFGHKEYGFTEDEILRKALARLHKQWKGAENSLTKGGGAPDKWDQSVEPVGKEVWKAGHKTARKKRGNEALQRRKMGYRLRRVRGKKGKTKRRKTTRRQLGGEPISKK